MDNIFNKNVAVCSFRPINYFFRFNSSIFPNSIALAAHRAYAFKQTKVDLHNRR